jgi:S-layer homology domain/Cysteine-rich secretory protein family
VSIFQTFLTTAHFFQVIWKDTKKVGCAYVSCSTGSPFGSGSWWNFVCQYSPPGNYVGQSPVPATSCASGDPCAIPRFTDVPAGHMFFTSIQAFAEAGITRGCSATTYCPDSAVTRGQMAVFLLRAMGESPITPTGTRFTDVPASHQFAGFIERFAQLGITNGCGASTFCPSAPVTRAQMAVFVLRALGVTTAPAASGTVFADVASSHMFCGYIEEFSRRGITRGCGGGNYCPDNPVTRGQMAIFIVRAFSIPLCTSTSPDTSSEPDIAPVQTADDAVYQSGVAISGCPDGTVLSSGKCVAPEEAGEASTSSSLLTPTLLWCTFSIVAGALM